MLMDEIEQLMDEKVGHEKLRECVSILLESMNDWPTAIESTEEFSLVIGALVKGDLREASISQHVSSTNYAAEAWVVESLSGLIRIFKFFPQGSPLNIIFESIENELLHTV
jgi:hypothetical protein